MNTTLQDTREAQAMWNRKFSGSAPHQITLTVRRREGLRSKLSRAFSASLRRINSGLPVAAYQSPYPRFGY